MSTKQIYPQIAQITQMKNQLGDYGMPLSGDVFVFPTQYSQASQYSKNYQFGNIGVSLSEAVFHFTFHLHSFSFCFMALNTFTLKKSFLCVSAVSFPNARVPLYIAILSTTFTKYASKKLAKPDSIFDSKEKICKNNSFFFIYGIYKSISLLYNIVYIQ